MTEPTVKVASNLELAVARQFTLALETMRFERQQFWVHWGQLSEVFKPRRMRWFVVPNQQSRGSMINGSIIDETGVLAARTLSAGMISGLTSKTRPWFRLGLHNYEQVPFGPIKVWLNEVERRMYRVLAESNFYDSIGQMYEDVGTFCSAAMLTYEDDKTIVCFHNPALGEFFFGLDDKQNVCRVYREFTMTVYQLVQMFGLENCSQQTQASYLAGSGQWGTERVVRHGIEENVAMYENNVALGYIVPESFPYREVYWEYGQGIGNVLLRAKGYNEKPFMGARWSASANSAYGDDGPGMQALPATRQLQVQQKRKGQAIDKLVNPPMVASISMRNEPKSVLPGDVSYVQDMNGAGFKPAYQVNPQLQEMVLDIAETQNRIKSVFFSDLFLMISQLDTVRTATEIDARKEEKLIQLGPVVERFENDVLDPIIERTFAIMWRRGLIPPPPPELGQETINVSYISILAEAARISSTLSTERVLAVAGNLVGVKSDILDNFDLDYLVKDYADKLYLDPRGVNSDKVVAAIRAQRAQQQQATQQVQMALATAQGAKTLSETQVGGGQNALERMIQ